MRMKRLLAVVMMSVVGASCPLAAETPAAPSPLLTAYQRLIASASNTSDLLALLAPLKDDSINRPELTSPDLLDFLAEALQLPQGPPMRSAGADISGRHHEMVRSGIVRYLDRHGGGRYHRVVLRVANEREQSEAKQTAVKLLNRKKTPPGQYVLGTVDLAAFRDAHARAVLKVAPRAALTQEIANLRKHAPFDAVVERLGPPDAVSARLRRFGRFYSQQMNVFYRGIGRLGFIYRNGRGWLLRGNELGSLAYEHTMPYRHDPARYGQPDDESLSMIQLLSGEHLTLRIVLESREDRADATLEFLDTAAEILLQSYRGQLDRKTSDINGWICILLARHGGPRYADVLAKVASGASNKRLVDFASETINRDVAPVRPAYREGSVSLVAQRVKYPSPYATIDTTAPDEESMDAEDAPEDALSQPGPATGTQR
jgi:hypothetical protein